MDIITAQEEMNNFSIFLKDLRKAILADAANKEKERLLLTLIVPIQTCLDYKIASTG